MNQRDLKPVNQLVQKYGVKSVGYGGPGSGKTPLVGTAPRPVMCVVEPGLLSMRSFNFPAYEAYTRGRCDEFFEWFFKSNEAKQFDTLALDSISQYAEIILTDELKKNKDGRAAYGKMSVKVMELLNDLYYLPNKHIYLIAKQGHDESTGLKKPFMPGQDLNVRMPHMYDLIFHLGMHNVGVPNAVKSIQTFEDFNYFGRDRSGNLNNFEPPDLSALFNKAMQ